MAVAKKRPNRGLRLLIVLILAGLIAGLALLTDMGLRLYARFDAVKQRLDRVEAVVGGDQSGSGLSGETLAVLRQEFVGGRDDFRAIQAELQPFMPLAARLGWLPKVGPSIAAAPHLMAMGEGFLAAGGVLLEGLDPLLAAIEGSSDGAKSNASITERVLPPLIAAQPRLVEAADLLERATVARNQIDAPVLLPPLGKAFDKLDKYLPALRAAAQGASVAPVLLGAVRPMNYVILAQNNDELRPTGGFISAIGVMTLDKGKITRLDFKNSYDVDNWEKDHPAPPEPYTTYMDAMLWVFRDSNWWPDYPTSAKAAEYFSQLDLGILPDGIIAVDQYALQILVGGMGSVTVAEYNNDVITAENTIAKIRAYWEPPGGDLSEKWYLKRKDFMNYLVSALRDKLEKDARSISLPRLGKAVLQALNEKHVLVYLRESLGAGWLRQANWDGAIVSTTGDYLFVVDTNMGFNKVNGVMQQSIDYSVSLDPSGLARSQLQVSYKNPSVRRKPCVLEALWEATYEMMMDRCYWDYLRIYIPAGSTVIADDQGNDMQILEPESGKKVLHRYMVLGPQESTVVAVGYFLPKTVLQKRGDAWQYRLLVQKQPGTWGLPLRVRVALPAGSQVVSASPAPQRISGNVVEFETRLTTDLEFTMVLR